MPAGQRRLGPIKLPEVVAVVTVTVTGVELEPSSVTELGTEHVDPAGAPLQLSDTVCLNPPAGATATV
jgi:hypothetical protein